MIASERQSDPRYIALKRGLEQLTRDEIQRILDHIDREDEVVVDHRNYDEGRDTWCPLAIGLDVPRLVSKLEIECLTDTIAKRVILRIGNEKHDDFTLNPLRGIEGQYFREQRREDLKNMCEIILAERESKE